MLSSDVDFKFPVLGFTPDSEIWGFPDLDRLTRCGPTTVGKGRQTGMELIDADLRRWIVKSVDRIGPGEPFFRGLVTRLLTGTPQSRIAQEVESLSAVSLGDLHDRASAALRSFPDDYGLYEPDDLEAMLGEIRKTTTVQELFELLSPDTFESY